MANHDHHHDHGKQPLIDFEEDEYPGAPVVFGNLEFRTGGGSRLPASYNVSQSNVASSSSALATQGRVRGHTGGEEEGFTSCPEDETTTGEAIERQLSFPDYENGLLDGFRRLAIAGERPTVGGLGTVPVPPGVSANSNISSIGTLGQHQTFYSPGNTHGSIVWDPNYNTMPRVTFRPGYFAAGSPSGRLSMNPIPDSPMTQAPSPSTTDWMMTPSGNTSFIGPADYDHRSQLYGPYSPQQYFESDTGARFWIAPSRADNLTQILESGDYQKIDELISVLCWSDYLELMTLQQRPPLFRMLVDACNPRQLQRVAGNILSDGSFMEAARTHTGSKSIIRLIQNIKKFPEAFTLTRFLSTRFWVLMTQDTSKDIIHKCFIHLTEDQNEVLFEKAIEYSQALAQHPIGCPTLNYCIRGSSGERHRIRLLRHVANLTPYLAGHLLGNFTVQAVLSLQISYLSRTIVEHLRGRFVELSMQKAGSRVVERCIHSSPLATVLVCVEIASDERTVLEIAQNEYGNYVIQQALIAARKLPGEHYRRYHDLKELLVNHRSELNKNQYGRALLRKMKEQNMIGRSE